MRGSSMKNVAKPAPTTAPTRKPMPRCWPCATIRIERAPRSVGNAGDPMAALRSQSKAEALRRVQWRWSYGPTAGL